MGGVQTQILTPPPTPWGVQRVEVVRTTFGPNLAAKVPDFFFGYMVRAKISLHPLVCMLKMLRILWGVQMRTQHRNEIFSPR